MPDKESLRKHMQTRHSLCITGSMDMHEKDERVMGEKTSVFHTFCKNFDNFILCIREHLFSFLAGNTINIFLQ